MFTYSSNDRAFQLRHLTTVVALSVLATLSSGAHAFEASKSHGFQSHVLPPKQLCPGMIYNRWANPPCQPISAYWPWWSAIAQFAISGSASPTGFHSIGTQFTIAKDAMATKIYIPISYVSGTDNAVNVSLATDDGGVPGKALQTRRMESLPAAGACCAFETVQLKPTVALTAGTPYWVVVTPDDNSDTVATWNLSVGDQVDPETAAFDSGSGWSAQSILPAVAVGVAGK